MKKGKSLRLIFGLFILMTLIFGLSLVSSLTASIGKPRMVLYYNYTGEPIQVQESVLVNNDNLEEIKITLIPTGIWEEKIIFDEKEFMINAGERKEVFYDVTITEAGYHKGDILVNFKDEKIKKDVSLAQELVVIVRDEKGNVPTITGNVIGGLNMSKIFIGVAIGLIVIIGLAIMILNLRGERK